MLCGCIEGFNSYVTAQGARRYMGRIGHELRSPILDAIQVSIQAIAKTQRILTQLSNHPQALELLKQTDKMIEEVNEKGKVIERMMQVAKHAALEEVSFVAFNFQRLDLGELIQETIETLGLQRELVTFDRHGNTHSCVVLVNDGMRSLGTIVGDADYLKVVFSHLLRNAAKYSLPRYPGKPIVIRVLGQPQSESAIVQIENWGIGIEVGEFETIFRTNVRGRSHDYLKPIPGLGLGLPVSRMLVKAHGGSVFCRRSVSTLDDRNRVARYEGYETVFEIRLPRDATIGVRNVKLGNGSHDR
jgi:signal transduction histidine kinase